MSVEIFYSYAHEDEALLRELEKHLSLLKRQGLIDSWHNRAIGPGQEWESEIDTHVNSADIVLLLVSPDFLASDYCYNVEMRTALYRHKRHDAVVIPIILRPVDWSGAPFAHLQALPRDGKPVTSWASHDEAFTSIAQEIRMVILGGIRRPSDSRGNAQDNARTRVFDAALPGPVIKGPATDLAQIPMAVQQPDVAIPQNPPTDASDPPEKRAVIKAAWIGASGAIGAALIVGLFSLSTVYRSPERTARLRVRVVDQADGVGLPAAEVTADTAKGVRIGYTDSEGYIELTLPVTGTSIRLMVTRTDYEPVDRRIAATVFEDGETVRLTKSNPHQTPPVQCIAVTFYGSNGNPVTAVSVVLTNANNGVAYPLNVTREGRYCSENLSAGAYLLAAVAPGYKRVSRDVMVSPNGDGNMPPIRVEMQPLGPAQDPEAERVFLKHIKEARALINVGNEAVICRDYFAAAEAVPRRFSAQLAKPEKQSDIKEARAKYDAGNFQDAAELLKNVFADVPVD